MNFALAERNDLMENIRLCEECISCIIKKFASEYPENCSEEQKLEYIKSVLGIISEASLSDSAPALVRKINELQENMWGSLKNYTDIKFYFNNLMLSMENKIRGKINKSTDKIESSIKYAMMGNYIDFGTEKNVDEEKLLEYIDGAEGICVNREELLRLEKELEDAERLVYLTDNCGEIVTDKILISYIIERYPKLKVEAIVRGGDVLNDATMIDAKQVGLCDIVSVSDNGTRIAGTCLDEIDKKAKAKIERADVIIAKGQGNFETMRFCEKNVYYLFMCKCELFARRFNVERYSGMLINDLRMPNI